MRSLLYTNFARDAFAAALAPYGDVVHVTDLRELPEALPQAEALVMSNPAAYTPEVAACLTRHGSHLRWLQLLSAGYDPCVAHGIPAGVTLCNAGEAWSPRVAEHAVALLLALLRRLPAALEAQAEARWWSDARHAVDTLEDRRLLILGFGGIGRNIARRVRPFGMHVVGMTRSGLPDADADRMAPITALRDELAEAEAVVVAVPLTPDTRGLLGAAEFAACRRAPVLVNVARGGVVDTAALVNALRNGSLAGAGLDVTDPEPLPPDHPLWRAANILITPHIAGFGGSGTVRRLQAVLRRNAEALLSGQPPHHIIAVPTAAPSAQA